MAEDDYGHDFSFWEVRKWLWESREKEITHMWHRGAFLTTFIVGTYTWYVKLLFAENIDGACRSWGLLALSFVCVIWSFLWIALSKGASAWYAIYEKAINDLTNECCAENPEAGDALLRLIGEKCPIVKCRRPSKGPEWSNCLLRGTGGTFSLPRINIAIGHLLMVASLASYVWQALLFLREYAPELFLGTHIGRGLVVLAFVLLNLCAVIGWWCYSRFFLTSASLTRYQTALKKQQSSRDECTLGRVFFRYTYRGCHR